MSAWILGVHVDKERQREGIALAKNRGAYKGRKRALSEDKVQAMKARIANGDKKSHNRRFLYECPR